MPETTAGEGATGRLPSVNDLIPSEEGGPISRSGFNYQDEIAVGFLVEMLGTPSLLAVHCETNDDIVLVHDLDGSGRRSAEYVQVKASAQDQLWSVARLCTRKGGRTGTSVFEISLQRDECSEDSIFRLVTLRPVVQELRMLTFPRGAPGREADGTSFTALMAELDRRFPGCQSPKRNGTAYWLENCLWDVRDSEPAVREHNTVSLLRLSMHEGRLLLLEHAELLADELRAWAKAAGDARWEPDRDRKIITRHALREWWEQRTHELTDGAADPSGGKLREKMAAAALPEDMIALAVDLRLDYSAAARSARYMDDGEYERLQGRVKTEAMSLRSSYVAGQLDLDSAAFHALCIERMKAVNAERPAGSDDQSGFLTGCMYDIADRCLLRFTGPSP